MLILYAGLNKYVIAMIIIIIYLINHRNMVIGRPCAPYWLSR